MLYPLDLSSQRIFRQQKHNGEKRQAAKEYIAICKTQVLLQNMATTFAHQSTLLVTEMSSLKNKK